MGSMIDGSSFSGLLTRVEIVFVAARRRLIGHTSIALKFHVVARKLRSFPHFIFDRIGGGRESVCATGRCFDAFSDRS
jgi:hypothetical protein